MSLHITAYTPEGIIMASDSRVTLRHYRLAEGSEEPELVRVSADDSANKLLAVGAYAALSLSGYLNVDDEDLLSFAARFARHVSTQRRPIAEMAQALLESFRSYPELPEACFHLAGYDPGESLPCVYRIRLQERRAEPLDTSLPGFMYNGDTAVVDALLQDPESFDCDLQSLDGLRHFALDALQRTSDTLPPVDGLRTVGGPLDLLEIRPDGLRWLRRKPSNPL